MTESLPVGPPQIDLFVVIVGCSYLHDLANILGNGKMITIYFQTSINLEIQLQHMIDGKLFRCSAKFKNISTERSCDTDFPPYSVKCKFFSSWKCHFWHPFSKIFESYWICTCYDTLSKTWYCMTLRYLHTFPIFYFLPETKVSVPPSLVNLFYLLNFLSFCKVSVQFFSKISTSPKLTVHQIRILLII